MRALIISLILLVPAAVAANSSTWWEAYQSGEWRTSSPGGSPVTRDGHGRASCPGQLLRKIEGKLTADGPCVLRRQAYHYHCVAIEGHDLVVAPAPAGECVRLCDRGEPQRVACE